MTRFYMLFAHDAVYKLEDLQVLYQEEIAYHDDEENWCPKKQLKADIADGMWLEVEPRIEDADDSNPDHWISISRIVAAPQ